MDCKVGRCYKNWWYHIQLIVKLSVACKIGGNYWGQLNRLKVWGEVNQFLLKFTCRIRWFLITLMIVGEAKRGTTFVRSFFEAVSFCSVPFYRAPIFCSLRTARLASGLCTYQYFGICWLFWAEYCIWADAAVVLSLKT